MYGVPLMELGEMASKAGTAMQIAAKVKTGDYAEARAKIANEVIFGQIGKKINGALESLKGVDRLAKDIIITKAELGLESLKKVSDNTIQEVFEEKK